MSYREYAVLHINWMAIFGFRFSGYLVPIEFLDFDVVSELLDISYHLTRVTRRYFGPTDEPQIRMEWLRMNIP